MKEVYICYETWGLWGHVTLLEVFDSEDKAVSYCLSKQNSVESDLKPEYDDWGLISGVEYTYKKSEVK